ncbi:Ribosomal RNA small subunit methyltransferase J [Clarias magur]|uniref:Ribosomal RNA small subunit methyltransferase J n=1 Tax=Clarias magur TaxID=1594786 RepID=A0A8J4U6H2_CLAMG|nr:Ribosomal RNA small subunit methyltransferase J [Clarias magur]
MAPLFGIATQIRLGIRHGMKSRNSQAFNLVDFGNAGNTGDSGVYDRASPNAVIYAPLPPKKRKRQRRQGCRSGHGSSPPSPHFSNGVPGSCVAGGVGPGTQMEAAM